MKCELCGKREAVIHVQQAIGNESLDIHLCEACAHEKGISKRSDRIELSLTQLLTGLLDIGSGEGDKETDAGGESPRGEVVTECPTCGLPVADFKKEGRLGCPDCYTSFAAHIRDVHRRLSGVVRHRGKLPEKLVTYKELLLDRERLRGQLSEAVAQEDYETAAILRDRIRALEKK